MDIASRYWQLVRLTSSGQCQVQVLPQVKAWFQDAIAPAPDTDWAQMIFLAWAAGGPEADLAQLSLRCFISHQIQQVCLGLAQRFGRDYGFAATDLFYLVLDDDGRKAATPPPFSLEILTTYDPAKAALSTWASRRTSHHPALNQALLEKGLYRASDWAILNDTQPAQLQRILRQYHLCSEYEVAQAATLLERYQQVYQRARIAQRLSGQRGRCPPPPHRPTAGHQPRPVTQRRAGPTALPGWATASISCPCAGWASPGLPKRHPRLGNGGHQSC